MSALLKVSGLRAGYGRVPVLHGIDLTVNEGEILGVLGHNGMGKSTLLKTLMGIIPANGGSMVFDGQDMGRMRSSARAQLGIGYVPQGRGIFPNLSVRDNLRMGVAAHDIDEETAIDRVMADFPRLERLLDRDGGAIDGDLTTASGWAIAGGTDRNQEAVFRLEDPLALVVPEPRGPVFVARLYQVCHVSCSRPTRHAP